MDSETLRHQLQALATSHLWTWDHRLRTLLDRKPNDAGDSTSPPHPIVTVNNLTEAELNDLAADAEFVARLDEQWAAAEAYLADRVTDPAVAYFSPEFGISDRIPQYSGGLGILAGDHLKASSDLSIPLCAVGLFYRQGFFRQTITKGRQTERYETHTPENLGAVDSGLTVEVPMASRTVTARIWTLDVGRIKLVLLDTDVKGNRKEDRKITDRLYSGDRRHRLEQEMILGVGGARALHVLGLNPPLYHLNEGHAGFLILELLDRRIADGATLPEALALIEPHLLFTTHTPVPAGIDRFHHSLIGDYLAPWAERWSVEVADIAELGLDPDGDDDEFNMALFCLQAADRANGVSKLHGKVSRELFGQVDKGTRIGSVTNGVHARTWITPRIGEAFDEIGGPGWADGDQAAWDRIAAMDASAIRNLRRRGGEILAQMVQERTGTTFDPEVLTVGFARRFATYKRADLLLRHRKQLEKLLADDDTPIQFVFAGKAHPADEPGKALLANIVEFARSKGSNGRFVFVSDYDIAVASAMYAGCDVWLNNPVRPREASGTSGEKAALNGGLNCSISDGWWDEMATDLNGWTIPASDADDPAKRDAVEAKAALDIITDEIVPAYWAGGEPWGDPWIERVRACWTTLGPKVTAARMLVDYRDEFYQPMLDELAGEPKTN